MDNSHVKHTTSIKLGDGTTTEHTAEALRYKNLSDGAVAVFAACCGAEAEGSWHTLYDVSKMTPDDIKAEVAAHVQRKAEHHASVHLARECMLNLIKDGAKGQ